MSANLNISSVEELPIPQLNAKQRTELANGAAKLAKQRDNLADRARLEVFITRDLYRLSLDEWKYLTGTFIYGGDSDSKADLDEIIETSFKLW